MHFTLVTTLCGVFLRDNFPLVLVAGKVPYCQANKRREMKT
jgi:hypothetical protein